MLDKYLTHDFLGLTLARSVGGNINWLGFVIPPVRAFLAPFIAVQVECQKRELDRLPSHDYPTLHNEITKAVRHLKFLLSLDPGSHAHYLLTQYRKFRLPFYSDASGYAHFLDNGKNPTPETIAIHFRHVKYHYALRAS